MTDTIHVRPADVPHRHYSLATLRSIFANWDERRRFRRELECMSKANPHLLDDIGMTRRQVEAEIAKPLHIAFGARVGSEWWHRG